MRTHIVQMNAGELILKPGLTLKKLYLEISSRCNFSCPMCFKHAFTDGEGHLDKQLFYRILDDLKEFPAPVHLLFGGIGECTVHPDFDELVAAVKDRGHALTIATNGYLLDDRRIALLLDAKVDEIVVSVETGDIGHASFRHVQGLVRRLEAAKKERAADWPAVIIETVLTRDNYADYGRIVDALSPHGVRRAVISNLMPTSPRFVGLELYGHDVSRGAGLRKHLTDLTYAKMYAVIPQFTLNTERHCNFVDQDAAVVRWDGALVPCYRFLHDGVEYVYGRKKEIKAHSFGSLKESSLADLWTSRDYALFRHRVGNALFPSCTDCDLKDGCQFVETTEHDCWSNSPSCADCLWWRNIIMCP